MPNKANAKKALRQSAKRSILNQNIVRTMEYAVKQTRKAIAAGKKEEASKLLLTAQKLLDKTAQKGIIKKNNASRRKSRLTNAMNAIK